MGRPRTFDEAQIIARATATFVRHGYAGTSVDDLVTDLRLHRGSIYQAFGSKRGLFLKALDHCVAVELPASISAGREPADNTALELILVAAVELAPADPEIRAWVDRADALLTTKTVCTATTLGARLWARAHPAVPEEGASL